MLYYNIGAFLCDNVKKSSWGEAYIDEVAKYMVERYPEIKGFNRRGLYRMKQFYETYKDDKIVTPLVTPLVSQITWTNHLLILSKAKTSEERQFYIQLCIKERYSKRELDSDIPIEAAIDKKDVVLMPNFNIDLKIVIGNVR